MAVSRKSNQARLAALQSSMLGCARCAALVGCRSRVVPGAGMVGASVAFVGIAPGRLGGDRTGVPFSGDRSGNLLREMIAKSGLHDVFITNLVRCNPRDPQGRNRDPDADEIANCREHLEAEPALVRPKVVACLGRMAWLHLAGKQAAFDPEHGGPIKADGWLLYPMYHPAYINRGAYPRRRYARDFSRLRLAIRRLSPS
jgi:uracil-DNA glycosylase family 4